MDAPPDGAASVVGWAGEEDEREGSEPHEDRRTLCRLTMELDELPLCPASAAPGLLPLPPR